MIKTGHIPAQLTRQIFDFRSEAGTASLPKGRVIRFVDDLINLMFPQHGEPEDLNSDQVEERLEILSAELNMFLELILPDHPAKAIEVLNLFFEHLPEIHQTILSDANAIYKGDPAATSVNEVISTYPGFAAISIFRIASFFYRQYISLLPRMMSEYAHERTGIDIHPGATIGEGFCIDHGTGIVIGETSVIGNQVKIYQGVTLGALSVEKTMAQTKRHPTIEDHVVIYSGATILGGETVIGHDSIIGGNVWLTESVAPFSVVYHKSEIRIRNTRFNENSIEFFI
ncbi:MAG: serine O-acetyltransferase [Bacteroidetes bacterium]|nr:serine O-acetyltransferase [Bacteroidota bacterium]